MILKNRLTTLVNTKYKTELNRKSKTAVADIAWDKIVAGDEVSYAKFVHDFSGSLFNYGYRLCNDRDFLKDCIQDLFVEVWNRREQLKVGEQFKGYLFKSLRNSIFRELSKFSRNLPLADEYDFKVEFDVEYYQIMADSEQELSAKVKRTLEHLPPRQKEILYLRYFEELPFDEIAEIMEISKQSSHNLLQKSYKSFREKWEIASETVIAVSVYLIFYYS